MVKMMAETSANFCKKKIYFKPADLPIITSFPAALNSMAGLSLQTRLSLLRPMETRKRFMSWKCALIARRKRDSNEVNRIGMISKMKHNNRKIRSKFGEILRLRRSQSLMPMLQISSLSFWRIDITRRTNNMILAQACTFLIHWALSSYLN